MSKNNPNQNKKSCKFNVEAMGRSQMQGFLMKKPVGHKATNWTRRYFVLKEGFLLYYAEAEQKTFETKLTFNIHPKGVIPLGYCVIERITFPGVSFGINVNFPNGGVAISLGADDQAIQREWINCMDTASKLTLENYSLCQTLLKSVENQNCQLEREKHEYYLKYTEEAKEVGFERQQRKELETFNEQLEEEKERIDLIVDQLVEAHDEIKLELSKTNITCKMLQEDREKLKESTTKLQESIMGIEDERNNILKRLQKSELEEAENNEVTNALKDQLVEITKTANLLEHEKIEVEMKLQETESKWQEFEEEKNNIVEEAEELKLEIATLNEEKSNVEVELKDEIETRSKLQDELKECKEALQRLEIEVINASKKLKSFGVDSSGTDRANTDVKSLKEFFENMEKSVESVNMATMKRNQTLSRRVTQMKKLRSVRRTKPAFKPASRVDGVSMNQTNKVLVPVQDDNEMSNN